MPARRLGVRYERLLMFAAPLSLAAFLVLAVSVAVDTQQDRVKARCYESAADIVAQRSAILLPLWEKSKPPKGEYWNPEYRYQIIVGFIDELSALSKCYDILADELDRRYRAAPSEIIEKLRSDAKTLLSTPLQLYGIELPEKATLSLVGTAVKINILPFTQLLQIALAPLLLLWLGSLYATRYRETLLIEKAINLADIFPHTINMYPVGHFRPLRKKNWVKYHWPKVIAFWYFLGRLLLLSVFIAPPVISYLLSLYFLSSTNTLLVFGTLGLLVFVSAFMTLCAELFPWHFFKVFSGPTPLR